MFLQKKTAVKTSRTPLVAVFVLLLAKNLDLAFVWTLVSLDVFATQGMSRIRTENVSRRINVEV
jgi:hypothetical protein